MLLYELGSALNPHNWSVATNDLRAGANFESPSLVAAPKRLWRFAVQSIGT